MDKIVLGRTGIESSVISLGTVELGLNYGIDETMPAEKESAAILNRAIESGINFFDTASSYGKSEVILGENLSGHNDLIIATKFNIPVDEEGRFKTGKELRRDILESIENSLENLNLSCLDILQIHNATSEILDDGRVLNILNEAKKNHLIKHIGASVYGEENANTVIKDGNIDIIQVPFNILDQRMHEIIDYAQDENIGVIIRSVYLKGALTKHVLSLPDHLSSLKKHVIKLKKEVANDDWENLAGLALRFALSSNRQSNKLIGVSSIDELDFALKCSEMPLLDGIMNNTLSKYSILNDDLLNPSKWEI